MKYYENLYKQADIADENIRGYLQNITFCKSLDEKDRQLCDKIISKQDLKQVVQNLKKNKAPGLDGLSNEFYQTFWEQLEDLYLNMLQESFEIGILPISLRKAVITLIFKHGEKSVLKNYRPISLTNCDYKILTFVLANRLQKVISKLISDNQSGYIKSRYIGINARLIMDIIENCEKSNTAGAILCLDYEKAFDSLNWNFMLASLNKYGFGSNFIKWVKTKVKQRNIRDKNKKY